MPERRRAITTMGPWSDFVVHDDTGSAIHTIDRCAKNDLIQLVITALQCDELIFEKDGVEYVTSADVPLALMILKAM